LKIRDVDQTNMDEKRDDLDRFTRVSSNKILPRGFVVYAIEILSNYDVAAKNHQYLMESHSRAEICS